MKWKFTEAQFFELIMFIGILPVVFGLALYGYLGIFSRYGSDDYCLSAFYLQKGDFISLMIQRYMFASSRYTNILFIGLVDKVFGWYNVAILPALMLVLFVLGLYIFLQEISRTGLLGWNSRLCLLVASWLVYFSVLLAPSLYQTLYWRAGMTSHFAPLVLIPFLGAFLLRQIRSAGESIPSIWNRIASLFFAFMLGGFSEPPVAILITILVLAIFAVWWWGTNTRYRRSALAVLPWALTGALLALAVLALAPANSIRLREETPGLIVLISKTMTLPFGFIKGTFKSFPIPMFVVIALSGLLFHLQYARQPLSREARIRLGVLFFVVLLIGYLLIAASFAPSIYGQFYPAARARFAGMVLLICMFIIDGAILGIILTNIKFRYTQLAMIGLFLLSFYPLRATPRIFAELPIYRQYAKKWDQRDAQMRAWKAEGVRDLVVPFLPEEVTQDLGDQRDFRLNRCAALLYGVDTVLAD